MECCPAAMPLRWPVICAVHIRTLSITVFANFFEYALYKLQQMPLDLSNSAGHCWSLTYVSNAIWEIARSDGPLFYSLIFHLSDEKKKTIIYSMVLSNYIYCVSPTKWILFARTQETETSHIWVCKHCSPNSKCYHFNCFGGACDLKHWNHAKQPFRSSALE